MHVAAIDKPRAGSSRSRFSKALPAVPGLGLFESSLPATPSTPVKAPQLRKELPEAPPPPPPPPHHQGPSPLPTPRMVSRKPLSIPLPGAFPADDTLTTLPPQKMSIPRRRPVGGATATITTITTITTVSTNDNTPPLMLPEPSPTGTISSLLSAYSRPFESPPTSPINSIAPVETPSTSSRDISPTGQKEKREAQDRDLPPPPPPSKDTSDHDIPPSVASKFELWRRRPQNDTRDLPGLELQYSHGSTVSAASTASSTMSSSTVSTQRPSTAVQDAASNTSQTPTLRIPRSVGGLPGRNIRPSPAQSDDDSKSSAPVKRPTMNLVGSKQSKPSKSRTTVAPPTLNRPPTPEYQRGETRTQLINTFTSPVSPAASPESPSMFSPGYAKNLPTPATDRSTGATTTSTPKFGAPLPTTVLNDIPRRKPAALSPVNGSPAQDKPQLALSTASPFASDPSLVSRTPTTTESGPSDQSRGSSISPTRRRRDNERTPRQQRQGPATDSRMVQTEHGLMYRGRSGTLYPEMTKLREPDPRAFNFPTWKGKDTAVNPPAEGIFSACELRDSHYSCFQNHNTMNRRTNRHYPLACQTCNKANADDRWACSFCYLRICEPCFRVFDSNQRDLKKLVADIGSRTPLSLSSTSRPASAFGL